MEPGERLADLTKQIRERRRGDAFLKMAFAIGRHPRNLGAQVEAAKQFRSLPNLPDLIEKAAVAAGDTITATRLSELADFFTMTAEWIAAVSKKTILGRLDYVRVPFQTRTILATDGIAAGYVAEGGALPVQAANLSDTETMARLKVGCIAVTTNELLEVWSPGSQAQMENLLALAVQRGTDAAALDPDSGAVAGERPASLLNGISPLGDFTNTAAGALADIETLLAAHVNAGSDLDRCLMAMHPRTALTLSLMQNSNGNATFPALTAVGGFIAGVPVATAVSCVRSGSPSEKVVAVLDGGKICVADDGEALVDASRFAALAMDSAPSGLSTGSTQAANLVSMMQTDSTAIRVRRYLNFQRAADSAVSWMTANF